MSACNCVANSGIFRNSKTILLLLNTFSRSSGKSVLVNMFGKHCLSHYPHLTTATKAAVMTAAFLHDDNIGAENISIALCNNVEWSKRL